MHLRLLCSTSMASVLLSACAAGLGPSTAATRPLLGHTMSNDDATMWAPARDQTGVPRGFVRVQLVEDGFARVFDWISVTSALRKGSATPTVAGVEQSSRGVLELDAAMSLRIPLPVGGVSLGVGRVMSMEDAASLGGVGVRASVAPIAQLSLDFAHSWVSGTYDDDMGAEMDLAGTRTSLGGTVLLWGWNQFRFGISVAKAWTSADPYTSSGYTYQLVSTMY